MNRGVGFCGYNYIADMLKTAVGGSIVVVNSFPAEVTDYCCWLCPMKKSRFDCLCPNECVAIHLAVPVCNIIDVDCLLNYNPSAWMCGFIVDLGRLTN